MAWDWGLERKATDAWAFYGVIAVSVLAAVIRITKGRRPQSLRSTAISSTCMMPVAVA